MLFRRLAALATALIALIACAPPAAEAPPPSVPAPSAATAAPTVPTATSAPTTAPPSPTPIPPTPTVTVTPIPPQPWRFGYPIGQAGRVPGDGFFIRHGYSVENTWYNPGYWHTGEDWYALDGDTAGAEVYAIGAGTVVYVGGNYPGRVVIVQHAADLYSMYGHLDPVVRVETGASVARGTLLGAVLRRGDSVPNHLHYEVRTFLTTATVNGAAPRYPFRCGAGCVPGPGYWPIAAPDLPSDQGWRNPTHVVNGRSAGAGQVVVASEPVSPTVTLWSAPPGAAELPRPLGELALVPGEILRLQVIAAGIEDMRATGAASYQLWYQIEARDGRRGWVQAAVATPFETGSDGRASSVRFNLLPSDP